MKVLHVASFTGNIGDNANHQGLRSVLERIIGDKPYYENWEIRRCYQNYEAEDRWYFDESFVQEANAADLVVVGGGNFFEPWLEASATGTTIDFPVALLKQVTTPLAFYGVGFDTHKGYSAETLRRFEEFYRVCSEMPNVFLSFRNDGSCDNFQAVFPNQTVCPHIVPDGAFFFSCDASDWLPDDHTYWALNIAGDMKSLRFSGDPEIEWRQFLGKLASVLEFNLNNNPASKLVLFPHIPGDLQAINQLMETMSDFLCRSRVIVAPMWQGWDGCKAIFGMYQQCQLAISMRFHANVVPLVMGVPTIALSSYPKIAALYEELQTQRSPVSVQGNSFSEDLQREIEAALNSPEDIASDYTRVLHAVRTMIQPFEQFLRQQLSGN